MGKIIRMKNGMIRFEFHKSEILQFKNLKVGNKFITMPLPGDDDRHGGFKGERLVYCKDKTRRIIAAGFSQIICNAHRVIDDVMAHHSSNMWVIKIL